MRLLIIEDEKLISQPLKEAFVDRGFVVDCAENGTRGLYLAKKQVYDCVILDLNLPELDGIEVAKQLRECSVTTPVLMLTARIGQKKIIEGFRAGTDDYMTKPFYFEELLHRIQALIKRSSLNKSDELSIGPIRVDKIKKKAFLRSKEVGLNAKEYGILEYLMRNQGRPISQEELLEHVWGDEINLFTQTVRTNIKTLRKKVDPNKRYIKTMKGVGYVFE